MVKSYLRYVKSGTFGVIASAGSHTVFDACGKYALAPALEDVVVWNLKQGEIVGRWHEQENRAEVTAIARFPITSATVRGNAATTAEERYAVGYADGSIRVWALVRKGDKEIAVNFESLITFRGHKSSVTALCVDRSGTRLLSGARDTDVIMWDIAGETGLFRLRGHKDQVTALHFLYANDTNPNEPSHILSSSKDTLVKVWDITTQHCIETVVGHRSEVWSMALTTDGTTLITGTSDMELRVWKIHKNILQSKLANKVDVHVDENGDDEQPKMSLAVQFYGALGRQSKERVVQLLCHPTLPFFACQSADRMLEVYRIRSEDELKKKLKRRQKRATEKSKGSSAEAEASSKEPTLTVSDRFPTIRVVRASAKIRSFDFSPVVGPQEESMQLLVSLMNNSMEVYSVVPKDTETKMLCALDRQGHRSDIRTMALSTDDEMLLTAGSDSVKIWNIKTRQCMRTLPGNGNFAVCSAFVPGNRFILIGTKSGDLEIYDTWSSTLLETVKAHDGTIWSIDIRPDKKGFVTGGTDKDVKFWDFGAVEDAEYSSTSRRLTVLHMRTLRMSDEVLCVKYTPNQNMIAVALLDATVKVFFHDTLKFFLSLYGHKLPVMSMDISSDNNLLVTASADKNVKLWGLDFGDCHKSIFAHTDSIMSVKFVPETHYFFTCSKDHGVKYWDGDKFEQIMKLDGHHGEVWSLCIGRWGSMVVTAGHDKSIRVWNKSDEQLFLEEEREKEMEDEYEQEMMETQDRQDAELNGQYEQEAGVATRRTMESLKSGEKIMEALELAEQEFGKMEAYQKSIAQGIKIPAPESNPLLKALGDLSPELYLLQTIQKIRSSTLEESLLVLPFAKIVTLLRIVQVWVQRGWNTTLTSRILMFVLKTYHNQLTANQTSTGTQQQSLRPMLETIRSHLRDSLQKQKDMIGYNVAGIKYLRRTWEQEHVSEFAEWEEEVSQLARHVKNVGANGGPPPAKGKKQPKAVLVRPKVVADA